MCVFNFFKADRYATALGLSALIPTARRLHKRATVARLVSKGDWRLAATLCGEDAEYRAQLGCVKGHM